MPERTFTKRIKLFLMDCIAAVIWMYYIILFGWLTGYLIFGDRGYLALVNTLALYLFYPLPLVAIILLWLRRRNLWGGMVLGGVVFMLFWGGLFLPQLPKRLGSEPTLTVMTYNNLVNNQDVAATLAIILNENPDVVLLQEVNQELIEGMSMGLGEIYPYQIVTTIPGVNGMAIYSKTPVQIDGEDVPLIWTGEPQVAWLTWEGKTVGVVNFHMMAPGLASPGDISWNFRYREGQAQSLIDLATRLDGPIIFGGDANLTSLSGGYKIITRELRDSWREAGFGFGHTFPGSNVSGNPFYRWGPFSAPRWLVRIDYIFVSDEWMIVDARVAEFDGGSDHRGVIVELALPDGR